MEVGVDGVVEFFLVKIEDEDFVALLEEMSGEAAADALGGWGGEGC